MYVLYVCIVKGEEIQLPTKIVKIASKGAFYIKKFKACKSGKNCVGVDNT